MERRVYNCCNCGYRFSIIPFPGEVFTGTWTGTGIVFCSQCGDSNKISYTEVGSSKEMATVASSSIRYNNN